MQVAFYNGWDNKDANIYDKLICIWTLSKYSHCEVIFSDGISFSSSPRDGGCRYKNITYKPNNWDIYDLAIDNEHEGILRNFCDRQVGKKYDWRGIFFSVFLPLDKHNPNRWFCSEVLATLFKIEGPSFCTPDDLYEALEEINLIDYKN